MGIKTVFSEENYVTQHKLSEARLLYRAQDKSV